MSGLAEHHLWSAYGRSGIAITRIGDADAPRSFSGRARKANS